MAKIKLEGEKALLLAEACKVDEKIKILQTKLKELKEGLDLDEPGTYVNDVNDTLVLGQTIKYSEIAPKSVMAYLKKNKMASRFPETVKVQLTPLKKLVPEPVIDRWRHEIGKSLRWSFK